ncbi:MAG TPA: hypothetical protein VF600_02925, partial [Abditibacteriaceae bacterium]
MKRRRLMKMPPMKMQPMQHKPHRCGSTSAVPLPGMALSMAAFTFFTLWGAAPVGADWYFDHYEVGVTNTPGPNPPSTVYPGDTQYAPNDPFTSLARASATPLTASTKGKVTGVFKWRPDQEYATSPAGTLSVLVESSANGQYTPYYYPPSTPTITLNNGLGQGDPIRNLFSPYGSSMNKAQSGKKLFQKAVQAEQTEVKVDVSPEATVSSNQPGALMSGITVSFT